MKRLLLGLVIGAFLTLVGAQASHAHDSASTEDSCAVCALAHKAQRQAPSAPPMPFASSRWTRLAPASKARPTFINAARAQARAPPRAS